MKGEKENVNDLTFKKKKKRMGEKLFFIPFLVQKRVLDSVWLMLP